MFSWYQNATLCFAFLEDVQKEKREAFGRSRWFNRGWTLQELLAARHVEFFDQYWRSLGSKRALATDIQRATGIARRAIIHPRLARQASIAQKMSWASNRETTRPEDIAYCLLGLFDVNMPLLYGEGTKAFIRLQEEIIRRSNDQTIFAWGITNESVESFSEALLAPTKEDSSDESLSSGDESIDSLPPIFDFFENGAIKTLSILATLPSDFTQSNSVKVVRFSSQPSPYSMTNQGLEIELHLLPIPLRSANTVSHHGYYLGVLPCSHGSDRKKRLVIPLYHDTRTGRYHRIAKFSPLEDEKKSCLLYKLDHLTELNRIYITQSQFDSSGRLLVEL
jgi:hypothetical protein